MQIIYRIHLRVTDPVDNFDRFIGHNVAVRWQLILSLKLSVE